MKRKILWLFVILCLFCLAGCNDIERVDHEELHYTMTQVEIPVELDDEEEYSILDADDTSVLIQVYHSFSPDDPAFLEGGYSARTIRLARYHWETGQTEVIQQFDDDEIFCLNGVILSDTAIAYCCVIFGENDLGQRYEVRRLGESEDALLQTISVESWDPVLGAMDDEVLAVRYYEAQSGEYGLNLFTEKETIQAWRQQADSQHEFFWEDFSCNGAVTTYLTGINNQLTIQMIDHFGQVIGGFALNDDEKYYSSCAIDNNYVFLSIETGKDEKGIPVTALVVKDGKGVTIAEKSMPSLHRPLGISDGVLANDMDWNLYFLTFDARTETICATEIDLANTGIRWYDTFRAGKQGFLVQDNDTHDLWLLQFQ